MKTGIDTDGVLDRCSCGERAGFYLTREGWVAACSERCGDQTEAFPERHEAMCAWNKARRAERRALRRKHIRSKLDRIGMVIVWLLTGTIWVGVIGLFIMWRRLRGEP
jgi:hypothetical protein